MNSESKPLTGIAILENGRVLVKNGDYRSFLIQKGYGTKDDNSLVLTGEETLYLMSEGKLRLLEGGRELTLKDATEKLISIDPDVWVKFLVYRDLRDKGYVIRKGYGLGLDFLLYERGTYGEQPAKYLVVGVSEGRPLKVEDLIGIAKSSASLNKELILAVVDRRGEVVYYKLSQGFNTESLID
ncbi:MAG: tRNA-intron lyase [Candidatus Bathyarchaeia archaeon]